MTEDLGESLSRQVSEKSSPLLQTADFFKNGLYFNVVDYSRYVDIYITPAD